MVVDTPHDLNPQHVEIILGSLHDSAFRSNRAVKWNYKDPKDELVALGVTGKIAINTKFESNWARSVFKKYRNYYDLHGEFSPATYRHFLQNNGTTGMTLYNFWKISASESEDSEDGDEGEMGEEDMACNGVRSPGFHHGSFHRELVQHEVGSQWQQQPPRQETDRRRQGLPACAEGFYSGVGNEVQNRNLHGMALGARARGPHVKWARLRRGRSTGCA